VSSRCASGGPSHVCLCGAAGPRVGRAGFRVMQERFSELVEKDDLEMVMASKEQIQLFIGGMEKHLVKIENYGAHSPRAACRLPSVAPACVRALFQVVPLSCVWRVLGPLSHTADSESSLSPAKVDAKNAGACAAARLPSAAAVYHCPSKSILVHAVSRCLFPSHPSFPFAFFSTSRGCWPRC
jgi:hypothetical protein